MGLWRQLEIMWILTVGAGRVMGTSDPGGGEWGDVGGSNVREQGFLGEGRARVCGT